MFQNRLDAALQLVEKLRVHKKQSNVCVVALTRGGVVLGACIAKALEVSLDILIVRKIGAPQDKECAIGALGEYGSSAIDNDIVKEYAIPWSYIDQEILVQHEEIHRRQDLFRKIIPAQDLKDRQVILVDDGIATGYTMQVAIKDIRKQHPKKIIVAVPVAARDAVLLVNKIADEVVCLSAPGLFFAVGNHYMDFPQVSDEEVVAILQDFRAGL